MRKRSLKYIFGLTAFVFAFALVAPAIFAADANPAPAAPAVGAAPAAPAAGAAGLVKLDIKLPKPMFVGTPKNIKTENPNFETPTGKPRTDFMVPKDVTLLSAGKKVTASDNEPIIGEVDMITDSDKEGADGSFVEFGPGVQWVQVDLGAPAEIYAVVVWHFHSQARVYKDFIVRVSDDPDFVKDVKTIYNNDHDNSAGLGIGTDKEYIETAEGRLVDAKGAKGRYVRLYSNGNTSNEMNHMIEVDVYGRAAK